MARAARDCAGVETERGGDEGDTGGGRDTGPGAGTDPGAVGAEAGVGGVDATKEGDGAEGASARSWTEFMAGQYKNTARKCGQK